MIKFLSSRNRRQQNQNVALFQNSLLIGLNRSHKHQPLQLSSSHNFPHRTSLFHLHLLARPPDRRPHLPMIFHRHLHTLTLSSSIDPSRTFPFSSTKS